MKNYKLALYKAIDSSTEKYRKLLSGYCENFINDNAPEYGGYICDKITEFADNNTSIYDYDIKQFIINDFDAVEDAINEFGWDGCGGDLYKAGQMAEFLTIEREIYDNLEDVIKFITLDFLDSDDDANEDAERIWEELSDDTRRELLRNALDEVEAIDNNSTLDEIEDAYNNYVDAILEEGGAQCY